jgi:hypothetical protein
VVDRLVIVEVLPSDDVAGMGAEFADRNTVQDEFEVDPDDESAAVEQDMAVGTQTQHVRGNVGPRVRSPERAYVGGF